MANARRLELQTELEELLGSRNVYYQPPSTISMRYPAIRYSKKKPEIKHANNAKYFKKDCYEIIVIDREPDSDVIDRLLELQYCEFDRTYSADNLHHTVLTLYY